MSHNRAPKPGSPWYLPPNTYRTVVDYCYAYSELQEKLRDLDGMHSHEQDGMPRGNATSDPTCKEGMRRAELSKKIQVIEHAVKAVVPVDLQLYLFMGVTDRQMTCMTLIHEYGMPIDKNAYSDLRRQVYYQVAERIM